MDIEIWKPIPSYETLYEISNNGVVKSLRTGAVKCSSNNGKYKQVTLTKNGTSKTYKVHRLVAITFIPNPDNLPQINHKDENPSNNNVDNLEWCTAEYNNNYGRHREKLRLTHSLNGAKSVMRAVIQMDKNGNVLNEFASITEASNVTNTSIANISMCCKGNRKTAGGYKWKFKEVI